MGELTIYFVGVCVHLRKAVKGVPHRVVLLNASKGDNIHGHAIDPHKVELKINGVETPHPDGVHFSILRAIEQEVPYDHSFETCVPHLGDHSELPLPPLSEAARGKDKALATAYFDAVGKFSAEVTTGGASIVKLAVETPAAPVLHLSPFDGSPDKDITLSSGDTIELVNIAAPGTTEHDYDFLLNFRILEEIPKDATWPTEAPSCPTSNLDYGTIGPGCTNTNYP